MKNIIIIFLLPLLLSCADMDILTDNEIVDAITQPDYVSSSRAKKLDIPPDLTDIETNTEYGVPGEAVSYKDYEDAKRVGFTEVKVLENPEGMEIVKSGNLRWLVVNEEPAKLWPHLESFWQELGFGIKTLNKRTGVMETEWIKSSKLKFENKKGMASRFDAWLDGLSNLADRRKFRTRLENGVEKNTSEIYISQRSIVGMDDEAKERIKRMKEGSYSTDIYKIEEYIPSGEEEAQEITEKLQKEMNMDEYEINAEILRRLMTKLGMTDLDAEKVLANPIEKKNATLVENKRGNFLLLNDPFDRSWRRLSLALDIIGFITEDKNRSKGIFYVKYKDLELESSKKKNKGLIDKLAFWEDDEEEEQRIKEEEERLNNSDGSEEVDVIEDKSLTEEIMSFWGSDDEKGLGKNEKRYRIRIKEDQKGTRVFIDYPNGKLNNTLTAKSILNIIYEHLR
ncbi:outer membrane protein assembly factor BamC [Methylophilaceae bacterium]|mgnify:FL=1|jgi:outer membrane protein assembly factor BamC|nr:outer membrane protein assembly factor BamC [Methylophilaceae bacterium]|tara:strand:- start:3917 stop:5275 length:1359 start_codon:yes stop_codon:yes gene_type:complete